MSDEDLQAAFNPGSISCAAQAVGISVTTRAGENQTVRATVGLSLMEIIRRGGVDELLAICGGMASCATCHIYVDADHIERLPTMRSDERDLVESSAHFRPNSRLACQIRFSDTLAGLRVTVAPED